MNKIKYAILMLLIIFQTNKLLCEWIQVHYEKYEGVEAIKCIDSNNCFAIVNHPAQDIEETGFRIYQSLDVGQTWGLIYKASYFDQPKVIHISDGIIPRFGYIFLTSDDDPIIMKSNDSGKTFKKIVLQQNANGTDKKLRAFAMYDTNYGFVANGYNYFTTTDGWETFEMHPKKNNLETFYSPLFLDSITIIMSYASSLNPFGMAVVKYHLKEDKFDTISYLGFDEGLEPDTKFFRRLYRIFFINDTLGFGSGSLLTEKNGDNYFDMIYRTTDGGYNWGTVLRNLNYPEVGLDYDIAFADENNGIAVGFYGKIAMTNDGGDTWVYEPTPNAMDNARKMLVCWAGRTPLIGTWDAGIFRYEGDFFKFPPDTTGIEDREITNYELQITPNPAEEYIELRVQGLGFGVQGVSDIKIYNVYGECLLTIPNTLNPEPKIDVSQFPAGIYFVHFGEKFAKFVKY